MMTRNYNLLVVIPFLLVGRVISATSPIARSVPKTENTVKFQVIGLGYPVKNYGLVLWRDTFADKFTSDYMKLANHSCRYLKSRFSKFLGTQKCPEITFFSDFGYTWATYHYDLHVSEGTDLLKLRRSLMTLIWIMKEEYGTRFRNRYGLVLSVFKDFSVNASDPFQPDLEVTLQGQTGGIWTKKFEDRTSAEYKTLSDAICSEALKKFKGLMFNQQCPTVVFWKYKNEPWFDAYITYSWKVYARRIPSFLNYFKEILRKRGHAGKAIFTDASATYVSRIQRIEVPSKHQDGRE